MSKKDDKPKKVSEAEGVRLIHDYLKRQNRPFNVLMLQQNLHGQVGKTQAQKAVDQLVDEGKVKCKEFGKQKIYWISQDDLPADKEGLQALEAQLAELKEGVQQAKEENVALQGELRALTSRPNDADAEARIKELTDDNAGKRARLDKLKEGVQLIAPAERKKIEKDLDSGVAQWRKRRSMYRDTIGRISESSDKPVRELEEDIGIEKDEDVGVSLEIVTKRLRPTPAAPGRGKR